MLVPLGATSHGEPAQREGGWGAVLILPGLVSLLLGEQEGQDVRKGRSRQDVCGR